MKNMSWSSHTFPRELFIEDVRRLSEDYTGEAGSWNFSANTWAEDLCAHLCTHQRRTTLLPGWCCTSRQLIPRLVCWSLGSIWTCVIFIALTSRYESGLSDKIWKKKEGPRTVEVERFVLSGSVYVHARLEKWPCKTSTIIQRGQIKLKKANTQNPIAHVFLSTQSRTQCRWLLRLLLWPFSDCTLPGIRRSGLVFQEFVSWRFKLVWENKYTQNYTLCYLKIFLQRLEKQ